MSHSHVLVGGLCCSAGASRRLNLLIAVMGDSFEKVKADEAAVAMFEQAQVIAISALPPVQNSPAMRSELWSTSGC